MNPYLEREVEHNVLFREIATGPLSTLMICYHNNTIKGGGSCRPDSAGVVMQISGQRRSRGRRGEEKQRAKRGKTGRRGGRRERESGREEGLGEGRGGEGEGIYARRLRFSFV